MKKLRDLGFPVPEFYVISSADVRRLADERAQKQLLSTFNSWKKEHGIEAVAVRSSANVEDGTDKSFAGQFTSVMDVRDNKRFIEALLTVGNSRPKQGYADKRNAAIDVVVQCYIEPDAAGVLFTVNPTSGSAEMVINAVSGHGSRAVNGDNVATIHVERPSYEVRIANRHTKQPISTDQILELSRTAFQIEHHLGSPQDIEWAFKDGRLHILQTRPITRINALKVWDNANIGESFPGIVMPLTFSIARRGYELVYKSQGYAGGLSWYQLEANHRAFHDMIGLFGGRMYYNLANWYAFIGLFPGNGQNQKFLDDQLQTVGDIVYMPPNSYPIRQTIRYFVRVFRRTVFFEREKRLYWQLLDRAFADYEALPNGKSLQQLLNRYTFVEQLIVPHMGRSADNDFFVMTYHGLLKARMTKWLGSNNTQTNHFLGYLHDVISARQAELLSEIAMIINHDKTAAKLLKDKEYNSLDTYLAGTDAGSLLNEYRSKFLHRFAGDQKIETVNPLLKIDGFYALIATYCQLDEKTLRNRRNIALAKEKERHDDVLRKLKPLARLQYRFLLGRLKKHLRIREHNRLLRGRAYALMRDLFPHVGTALVNSHIIDSPQDVYYLDIDEILQLINGTGYGDDLKSTIIQRKHRYESYTKLAVPGRFITTQLTGDLPPPYGTKKSTTTPSKSLPGTLSSPGDISGKVIILDNPIIPKKPFDILVVSHTDPGWTPLIALAKGVIVEHGGILSHAAIVTRELGIPSIIGVAGATNLLKEGMTVRINPTKGTVDIIS